MEKDFGNGNGRTRILKWLKAIIPQAIGVAVIPMAYSSWEEYTHFHFSFVQILFSDVRALHNLMPYGGWSLNGEIGLLLLNPGFVSGLIVGVAQVKRAKDIWKGLIPMGLYLAASVLAILYWRAFLWLPEFLIPALIGSVVGWQLRRAFRSVRQRTA